MFATANSIEPVRGTVATPNPEEPPVREATRAELAASARRRAAEAPAPEPGRDAPAAKAGLFRRRQAEPVKPDAISQRHGLYVAERRGTRTYFADYQQKQEVMRADDKRISTKQSDRQTVAAVLDLAQERGWKRVKLRGTEDFKRETWVQAQIRGIAAEGYQASATDEQEVARRKAAMAPVDGHGERPAAQQQAASTSSNPVASGEVAGRVKAEGHQQRPDETAARAKMGMPAPEAPAPATSVTGKVEAAPAAAKPSDAAASYDARIAAMTPEQRELLGRAARGDFKAAALYKATYETGKPPSPMEPAAQPAQDRQKAVWGTVEEAGRQAREAAKATASATAGERASAEAA